MGETIDDLLRQWERQGAAAVAASDAAQEFARNANGTHGSVMAAPTVYSLLGDIKLTLWRIREVTDYLPSGLAASLEDPRFTVYDRDFFHTGDSRNPIAQAQLAAEQLVAASRALRQAADGIEAAQVALNGQGLDWREPEAPTNSSAVEVCPTRVTPDGADAAPPRLNRGRTPRL